MGFETFLGISDGAWLLDLVLLYSGLPVVQAIASTCNSGAGMGSWVLFPVSEDPRSHGFEVEVWQCLVGS